MSLITCLSISVNNVSLQVREKRLLKKAFEIYDAGGWAMIDPNSGDTYHQSQLDLIYRFMQMDDITEIVKA